MLLVAEFQSTFEAPNWSEMAGGLMSLPSPRPARLVISGRRQSADPIGPKKSGCRVSPAGRHNYLAALARQRGPNLSASFAPSGPTRTL